MTGQVLDNRYRVERKAGEGGMSLVYMAIDMSTGDKVAIKALSPALSSDTNAMARLRREAELGKRLAHANVCHILALGQTTDGVAYVVMPYLEGTLLCDRTADLGQIPLGDTVRLVGEMAAGLQVAHALGIIHRDLKPENVMLCPNGDGSERAVVMDFGLAKQHRVGSEMEKLTATGVVLGTPEFMSPEQLRGKALDARTDIYSLALMTFEMLTGKLPFSGRTKQDTMIARLKGDPATLPQTRPDLQFPAGVDRVLAKGMTRDRDERYRTAPDFASALTAAASDEPAPSSWLNRILGK
jgi:serine/threonine-protein kinase